MHNSPNERRAVAANHALLERYRQVRQRTQALTVTLSAEDMVIQSMPDASPAKWHLAHTSWFFETFLLQQCDAYQVFHPRYAYLFNSYYEAVGARQPRPQRGMLSRPSLAEIMAYREHVDTVMQKLLESPLSAQAESLVLLGLAHEEQHQELLQMDVLHLFAQSPLKPAYDSSWVASATAEPGRFRAMAAGLKQIGHHGDGFAFDNDGPRHKVWLEAFEISDRLVTNGEWLAFINDGAYTRPQLWLAEGWARVQSDGWQAPLYWQQVDGVWLHMTLAGLVPVPLDGAVQHVSYYEAEAFARWRNARLPTEAEWETAAEAGLLEQLDDVAWQWTQSAYHAYPGFQPSADAVGEYNGKFMIGQMVLRGGASVTPAGHARLSYRNFYAPWQRWMFAGLRLARDVPVPPMAAIAPSEFLTDVIAGLSAPQKSLSPKYFYDALGSALFEDICRLPEYYPTRTESALLAQIAGQIASTIAADAVLVEYGSGASDKTRLLLEAAPQITSYLPIDISADALQQAVQRLAQAYPALAVHPVEADFTAPLALPPAMQERPKVGFFPGSTIGNFTPQQAVQFLGRVRQTLGADASLILGADMIKEPALLMAAYDDAAGVTARFNKNLLVRINRELQGNFELAAFDHEARWNTQEQRMEMHLVSKQAQTVTVTGQEFHFNAGESWHTENSHKFSSASLAALAAQAGWRVEQEWISAAPQFGVFHLRAN